MAAKKIAILGAGASGLTSIKACLDEGFQVICYELLENTGGLWRYYEDEKAGVASLMKSTIINSSKEMSAFSDFPPPANFPNYMHNSMMIKYLELYAEHFNLNRHIKFQHKVLNVTQSEDYDSTGKWSLKVLDIAKGQEFEDVFDGVMICTGHLADPKIPDIKGLDIFQGDVKHTHAYKKPNDYEDQNVLVIGVGNSGGDAAVELSGVTKKLYLSTRHGCWILKRLGPGGLPFDMWFTKRIISPSHGNSRTMAAKLVHRLLNFYFDHGIYGLKPKYPFYAQHPMVNDTLPLRITSGLVEVKNDISHFTSKGVVFEGELDQEYPIDSVVLGTGYTIKFPFLGKDVVEVKDNRCKLFKYMFPPQLKHPSLVFVGLVQPYGALMPISELQARWYGRLMAGKAKLPDETTMFEDIHKLSEEMAETYVASTRHTIQVDVIDYMDEIARRFGAKPNLGSLILSDPQLFWQCITGPNLPYVYRLNGPGAWEGAREAIMGHKARVLAPFKTRKLGHAERIDISSPALKFIGFIILAFLAYVLFRLF